MAPGKGIEGMNDKERIAYVRALIFTHMREKEQLSGFVISDEDYDEVRWLVSQAEKLQLCKESFSGLDKMYDHWRNKAKELEKQLQQAQIKAERYENALKHILENYHNEELDDTGYAIEVQQTAKQALGGEE
jgi:predicted RNase H-like nuclease (RuvC/YqgF family)